MTIAHDIYAETNPAFCAYILSSFVAAYQSAARQSAPIASAYLSLPISLSNNLSNSFVGTNRKTGLNTWVERNPHATLGLADRVNTTLKITGEAITFACFGRILAMDANASLTLGKNHFRKSQTADFTDESIRQAARNSEVLGYWFANAGSMRTVLDILGVSI